MQPSQGDHLVELKYCVNFTLQSRAQAAGTLTQVSGMLGRQEGVVVSDISMKTLQLSMSWWLSMERNALTRQKRYIKANQRASVQHSV